jgi:hypothetical protein
LYARAAAVFFGTVSLRAVGRARLSSVFSIINWQETRVIPDLVLALSVRMIEVRDLTGYEQGRTFH